MYLVTFVNGTATTIEADGYDMPTDGYAFYTRHADGVLRNVAVVSRANVCALYRVEDRAHAARILAANKTLTA